jgi:hypothetical protein
MLEASKALPPKDRPAFLDRCLRNGAERLRIRHQDGEFDEPTLMQKLKAFESAIEKRKAQYER